MKMRNLGALAVAAAFMTVGGVYAAWTFAGSDPVKSTTADSIALQIAGTKTEGARGSYSAVKSGGNYLVVNQFGSQFFQDNYPEIYADYKEDIDPHKAWLTANPAEDAKVTIYFTPNAGANYDDRTYGIPTTLTYSIKNPTLDYKVDANHRYDNENGTRAEILTLKTATVDILPYTTTPETGKHYWEQREKDGVDVLCFEIKATHLLDHVGINDFIVDTPTAYTAFAAAVGECGVTITISETVAVTP